MTLKPTRTGFDLDLSSPTAHKTAAAFGPVVTVVPPPAAKLLAAWLQAAGRHAGRAGAAPPYVFVPGGDAAAPLGSPRWTELVQRVFKKHAGVPLAPKELRSSLVTWLRSDTNSDAVLKSAAFAMRHSPAQAAGVAYDRERAERLSRAAVEAVRAHAARF